jgi:cbb3-type cytochrome c oxidase subunit III
MRRHYQLAILAASLIALAVGTYILLEPARLTQANVDLLNSYIAEGQVVYAENCTICHNAAGQGLGANPALNTAGVQQMDYDTLYKTIARGRYNTAMPAWSTADGGPLNAAAISALVALLQHGDWQQTQIVVADLGLAPRTPISVTVPITTLQQIALLPDGTALASAVQTYATNCVACHGSNGQGTTLAPALNDPVIRAERTADQLSKTIRLGSPGTVMAGWNQRLPAEEVDQLVILVLHWDQIPPAAIPEPPAQPIIVTEKLLATGQALYVQNCSRCHGTEGQGTRRAPALNVQSFFDKVSSDQAMVQIVSSGVPGTAMPAWGDRLGVSEIEAMVAYVRSWEATAPAVASPQTTGGGGPSWQRSGQANQPVSQSQSLGTTASAPVVTSAFDWRIIALLGIPSVIVIVVVVWAGFRLLELRKAA